MASHSQSFMDLVSSAHFTYFLQGMPQRGRGMRHSQPFSWRCSGGALGSDFVRTISGPLETVDEGEREAG